MFIEDMIRKFSPVWEAAAEGSPGGEPSSGGGTPAAGSTDDQGGADEGTVLGGGTAKGDDTSDGGKGDGDAPKDDDKAEGDKKPDDVKDEKKEGEGDIPEAYDFKEIMPEGVEVDANALEVMTPIMRELGLDQGKANKLVEGFTKLREAEGKAASEQIGAYMKEQVATAKADKEIGGANWDETVRVGNEVLKRFGTPETISELMVGQGVGNSYHMIQLLSRIGRALSDDTAPSGAQVDTSKDVAAEARWYPTTPTQKKG